MSRSLVQPTKMPVALSSLPRPTDPIIVTTKNAPQLSRVPLLRTTDLRVIIKHAVDIELPTIMKPLQEIGV